MEKGFTKSLIAYYHTYQRDLPWRNDPTPYHVWLSEIMLQQTRIEAVRGYYARFLDALPDVASLANAPEDVYMKLWEGLGYYSRVRNLHKAAQTVMERFGGELPSDYAELLSLPGIGEYTAAAVTSMAFQKPAVAVDGNLLRVFARLTSYEGDIKDPKAKKVCHAFFMERLPKKRPGDFNQALMDLGEQVCIPNGKPHCDECPLQKYCKSHAEGREEDFPVVSAKKTKREIDMTVILFEYQGLFSIEKRLSEGLLAGLYQFPNIEGKAMNESELEEYVASLGMDTTFIEPIGETRHIFTHLIWHMHGYVVHLDKIMDTKSLLFVNKDELKETYSIPSAFRSFKNYVLKH